MQYKVVPFAAAVASHQDISAVTAQLESLITSYASNNWEFVGFHQIQTFKAGTNGCFGFGAVPSTTLTTEFVAFRQ